MPSPLAITLHALGAEAASGTGSAIDLLSTQSGGPPAREGLELTLDVASGSGAVNLETAPSASGPWVPAAEFEGLTGSAAQQKLSIAPVSRYVRAVWVVDGADPLVFGLAGVSHVLYVLPRDVFDGSIPEHALSGVAAHVMAKACIDASAKAHGFFARRYTGPLVSIGSDVRRELAQIVAYMAMSHRGFAPDGSDDLIVKNHDAALRWLNQVGSGAVSPDVTDSTPTRSGSGARIFSRYSSSSGSGCERRVGDEDV